MDGGGGTQGFRVHDTGLALSSLPLPPCTQLDFGHRYQVRRHCLAPGDALPPCHHLHRAEHWTVVQGTARITRDGQPQLFAEGQSFVVPLGQVHAVENPGRIPLILIEVQIGPYFGDDDLISGPLTADL